MNRIRVFATLLLLITLTTAHAESGTANLELFGAPAFMSNSLEGDGFTTDLPFTDGIGYGARVNYFSMSNVQYSLKYNRASVEFETPTGLTPTAIQVHRQEGSFSARFQQEEGRGIGFGFGYAVLQYAADRSAPDVVVTDQMTHGPMAFIDFTHTLNDEMEATLGLSLYMPNNFSEKFVTTGHNPRYLGTTLQGQFNYSANESLVIFVGLQYARDHVSFDGSGDRGVTAGKDLRTFVSIPVGLRWNFN